MRKTYLKTLWRTLFSNKGRFLGNFAITMFAVLITAGLGAIPQAFQESFLENYKTSTVPDLIVKSKAMTGFSEEQVTTLLSYPGALTTESFFSIDAKENNEYYRFYIRDLDHIQVDPLHVLRGAMPQAKGEVLVEEGNGSRPIHQVGDTFSFSSLAMLGLKELTVSGVVDSPLYLHSGSTRANLEDRSQVEYVSTIFYIDSKFALSFLSNWKTDVYLYMVDPHDYMTDQYKARMDAWKTNITEKLGAEEVEVLSLEENESYILYKSYNEKIRSISYIFPFFFLLLCALVNSITVNRLVADERGQIATAVSLGEKKRRIINKYCVFSGASVTLGAAVGYFVGIYLVPWVVYGAYNAVFRMGPLKFLLLSPVGIATYVALLLITLAVTLFTMFSYLAAQPAELCKAKPPKPGKVILLERMGFIWNKLSFSLKSMFRNIFRLKKNFFLTSFSVIGSTLLVYLGFALLNVSNNLRNNELFKFVADSVGLVSTVIVLLAVGMSISVVYLLCNMNIEDRKREMATLKVLGYSLKECCFYSFREILFIAGLASLVALPLSFAVADNVFRYLDFGSGADIQWWTYVVSPIIIMATVFVVNGLLVHRIRKIDPVTSLKSVE